MRDEAADERERGIAVQIGGHTDQRADGDGRDPGAAQHGGDGFGGDEGEHQAFQQEGQQQPFRQEQSHMQRLSPEFGAPRRVIPEAPDDGFGGAHLGPAATTIADAVAQGCGEAAREGDPVHHRAAHDAQTDGGHCLGQREFDPQHARGQHEHRRVHDR